MGHRVKCLGEIQQYHISLLTKIDAFRPVVYCRDNESLNVKFYKYTLQERGDQIVIKKAQNQSFLFLFERLFLKGSKEHLYSYFSDQSL